MLIVSFLPITVFAVEGTPLTSAGGELTDGSYYLDQDVTLTDNLTVPENATVTLDLNGFTLQGDVYKRQNKSEAGSDRNRLKSQLG